MNGKSSKAPAQGLVVRNSPVRHDSSASHLREETCCLEAEEKDQTENVDQNLGVSDRIIKDEGYVYPRATETERDVCRETKACRGHDAFFYQFTLPEEVVMNKYKDSFSYSFDITPNKRVVTTSSVFVHETLELNRRQFNTFDFTVKSHFSEYESSGKVNPMVSTPFDLTQVSYKTVDTIMREFPKYSFLEDASCAFTPSGSQMVPQWVTSSPSNVQPKLHHPQSNSDQCTNSFSKFKSYHDFKDNTNSKEPHAASYQFAQRNL